MARGQFGPHKVMCFCWTCLGFLGLCSHSFQQGQQGTHASHTVHHILWAGGLREGSTPASPAPSTRADPPTWNPGSPQDLPGHRAIPAHPAHKLQCSHFLHTLSTWAHTFTSQVSTLWPVSRPSNPWPGDRSKQMLFLQAWGQGVSKAQCGAGGGRRWRAGARGRLSQPPSPPYLR